MLFDYVRKSFRLRLALLTGSLLFGVLSIYLVFFIQQSNNILEEDLIEQGTVLAENAAFAAELGVLAGDPTFAEASVIGIAEREEVVFLAIYNNEGRIIALQEEVEGIHSQIPSAIREQLRSSKTALDRKITVENTEYHEFFAPVAIRITGSLESGEIIGFTRIILSLEEIQEKQQRILMLYIILSLITFIGGGLLAYYLTNRSTQVIAELIKGTENVRAGDLKHRIAISNKDELGQLAQAFNEMTVTLQEARERDKAINELKSEFLTIAAHQLRTPLSAMKWVFQMAIEGDIGKITKQLKEHLKKGYDSNERMITLVDDLLDAVRIEEGRFDYQFARTSLTKVLEGLIAEVKVLASEKNIALQFHDPTTALPEVKIDAQKVRLAFMNILENAVHYTLPGGRIDISVFKEQDHILVTIQDTGIGIPKKDLPKLFTKFFRGANALRMETSGSGLGLFIARNIIEKHGGKMWLESEIDKGTTVYFTIPLS